MNIEEKIIHGKTGHELNIKAVGNYTQATASLQSSTQKDKEYVPFEVLSGLNEEGMEKKLLLITELSGHSGNPDYYYFSAWMLRKLSKKQLATKQQANPGKIIFPYEKLFYCNGNIKIE